MEKLKQKKYGLLQKKMLSKEWQMYDDSADN